MNDCYEFALVGAGAVSAGAYTAGVIDFLIDALDQWHAAKVAGEDVPPHRVSWRGMAGASAGGMTAALTLAALGSRQPPVRSPADAPPLARTSTERTRAGDGDGDGDGDADALRSGGMPVAYPHALPMPRDTAVDNRLFGSWVDRIDIAPLLGTRDLPSASSPVVSLFDSTVLAEIAAWGQDVPPAPRRPYVADRFELVLTLTNLRGVPYAVQMQGYHHARHDMSLHADHMHFVVTDRPMPAPGDRYATTWSALAQPDDPVTARVRAAALATGAYPLAFSPQLLSHQLTGQGAIDPYSGREWPFLSPATGAPVRTVSFGRVPLAWGPLPPCYTYRFPAVDGGLINNEPFELAQRFLWETPVGGVNAAGSGIGLGRDSARGADGDPGGAVDEAASPGPHAPRGVILIDPFPNNIHFRLDEPPPDLTLLRVAGRLLRVLTNQARFKPDELTTAADNVTFSRFMIAPKRDDARFALASGALLGFSGFLKRSFREHDFFLGRRNAQKFLKDHFVLPEDHPLFARWTAAQRELHWVRDEQGVVVRRDGRRLLPIVPLVRPVVAGACHKPDWPRYTAAELEDLLQRIEVRARRVLAVALYKYLQGVPVVWRLLARLILWRNKGRALGWLRGQLTSALRQMDLME